MTAPASSEIWVPTVVTVAETYAGVLDALADALAARAARAAGRPA